jgi:class I lanthipeptide synthase
VAQVTLIVPRFLVRAPLLPVAALENAARELRAAPLGRAALALALAAPARSAGARREETVAPTVARYGRRAAFRPTPQGLLAGVAVGRLGDATAVDTGAPRAALAPSWGRLAALGRALLEDRAVREATALRPAPSLLAHGGRLVWLRWDELLEADADDRLAAVLAAAHGGWTPWARVRRAAAAGDRDAADDYLLQLIDDRLLATDLEPPLVGAAPAVWMRERLARLRAPAARHAAETLGEIGRHFADRTGSVARLERAQARLDALPGGGDEADVAASVAAGRGVHAVLTFPRAQVTLARAAVARAAELAPLLFRLAEALVPPVAERDLDPAVPEAVATIGEVLGAGGLELAALATGAHGIPLSSPGEPERAPVAPPPGLLAALVDRLVAAAAAGEPTARFTAAELDAWLPGAPPPPSFELVLGPAREPPGAPPGTGWLLGLHGPAGATWGRFAHALGRPLQAALRDLAAAERRAAPGVARVDVAFAPAPDLADLAAHPPVRERALALTSWADAATVTPGALVLAAEPEPTLWHDGEAVIPSPLARLRSTTVAPGVFRLLAGWSLLRQHAPWALDLGPLRDLARTPRVVIEGFVVAPASWRLPTESGGAALHAWRGAGKVPRWVQVGAEDELLPVDLDSSDAPDELRRAAARAPGARAWELWPPPGSEVDAAGRRLEVVVAVVAPDARPVDAPPAAIHPALAGRGARGWSSHLLYGAPDRQDRVLLGAVAPAIRAALAAGDIDRWFFQRYVSFPGPRHHLRLRVRVRRGRGFAAHLEAALAPARAVGDVVTVATGPYLREDARFGAADVEAVFQSESELVLELLARAGDPSDTPDGTEILVRGFDVLARAAGLDLAARRALAARARAAAEPHAPPRRERDAEHRRRGRRLLAALSGAPDEATPALAAHAARLRRRSPPAALLPALLHLFAVRLLGPDRSQEALATYLWDRALEGLLHRR